MPGTKFQIRSGRRRGPAAPPANELAKQAERHSRPPHSQREAGVAREVYVKRNLNPKPPQTGGDGRLLLDSPSTYRLNRSNVKRKPEARRKSLSKKLRSP